MRLYNDITKSIDTTLLAAIYVALMGQTIDLMSFASLVCLQISLNQMISSKGSPSIITNEYLWSASHPHYQGWIFMNSAWFPCEFDDIGMIDWMIIDNYLISFSWTRSTVKVSFSSVTERERESERAPCSQCDQFTSLNFLLCVFRKLANDNAGNILVTSVHS